MNDQIGAEQLSFENVGQTVRRLVFADSDTLTTKLILMPVQPTKGDKGSFEADLRFYDYNGKLFNSLVLSSESCDDPQVIDLTPFLEQAAMRFGVGFGTVELCSNEHVLMSAWIEDKSIEGPTTVVRAELDSLQNTLFHPMRLGGSDRSLLCLHNKSNQSSTISLRCMCGSRMPEFEVSIAGGGIELVDLNDCFAHLLKGTKGRALQSYLTLRGDTSHVSSIIFDLTKLSSTKDGVTRGKQENKVWNQESGAALA